MIEGSEVGRAGLGKSGRAENGAKEKQKLGKQKAEIGGATGEKLKS
jgi:hypothetical protein